MKLVDTTFLIDMTNGVESTKKIIQNNETLLTTQINMHEFLRGLFLKGISKNKIDKTMELFENIKVLQLDDNSIISSAKIWAEMVKTGKELPTIDCLIAGIALSNNINTIITEDVTHFSRIKGLKVETY